MSKLVAPAPRRIEPIVVADLEEKMVLLSGPRQSGKTTLARRVIDRLGGAYFSWDVEPHRAALRRNELPESARVWVFDELHKLRTWRNWLKGIFDLHGRSHPILVTGSARLDAYSRGGDSLQGRYFPARLHPFTFSEVLSLGTGEHVDEIPELAVAPPAGARTVLDDLLRLGGFPEPLLSGSDRRAARWRRGYGALLVREDARELEQLRDLDRVERLFERLPATVGSPLSINALREDLEVAFATLESWVTIFERLYAVFRVPPWGPPRIKAVKKSQKLYFWDWARVEQPGARLENLVLSHLLRLVHWMEDVHGERTELRFARDVVGHEVDAIVLRRGRPWLAVEVKTADGPLDPGLRYFLERARVPFAFQVALDGTLDRRLPDVNGAKVRQVPLARFLSNLP
jgi:predicted AAA+ superfamily ATPase